MIFIDTTMMLEIATAAAVTNDAIDNAVDALHRISVHNDWGCKEKNAINDYTVTNKNKVRQLQENSRSYMEAIKQASRDFESSENSILDMFSSVEGMLADVLRIAEKIVVGEAVKTDVSIPGQFENIIAEWLKDHPVSDWMNRTWDDVSGVSGEVIRDDIHSEIEVAIFNGIPSNMLTFEAENFTEPLAVCSFNDISL